MVFRLFRSLFKNDGSETVNDRARRREAPSEEIAVNELPRFRITKHISKHNGLPIVDWEAVQSWVDKSRSEQVRGEAWTACERAWLLHFRDALGADYHLDESEGAALLSSLEPTLCYATLDYMKRTLVRVTNLLEGIAQVQAWGKDILIVFDNADSYYDYVSYYYPDEEREYSYSGGMHISTGCSHFVTIEAGLRSIEPVIAHEMTHGCLAHLPLPLWLNEGIAVNTERRLAGRGSALYTPAEMRKKHLSFWSKDEIQEFWSGESFYRPDDGNLLSYDLAQIMVEHMARDWERFRQFVLNADWSDGGEASAEKHLGIDLGEAVCSLLEKPESCRWSPDPKKWEKQRR